MSQEILSHLPHALAHDLAAPFRQIRGFHGLLASRAERLDDESREWLNYIGTSSAVGQAMIAGLANLLSMTARPEAIEVLPVEKLLAAAQERMAGRCRFQLDGCGGLRVDREVWFSAIEQLASNAREWGLSESLTVRVAASDGCVRFEAFDQGPGIDAGAWDLALRPFGRLSGCACPDHIGMGLPLACRALAVHGGHLQRVDGDGRGLHLVWEQPTVESW